MKSIAILICFILLANFTLYSQVVMQSQAQITKIDFELVNDEMIITYGIKGAKDWERFNVAVNVFKHSNQEKIKVNTLTGDIINQSNGSQKKIIWHIAEDLTYLSDNIYIELTATIMNPKVIPYISKKEAFLFSTVYPGLGTSKLAINKLHLTKGIAAYSLIGCSVISNRNAQSNYRKYKKTDIAEERDLYFSRAESSYRNSQIFLASSIAIWLSEYIWIVFGNNKTVLDLPLSIGPSYNLNTQSPNLSLTYTFNRK